MARKQKQVKQVWLTDQDMENFLLVGEHLQSEGVDVMPDNLRTEVKFSYTKVIRHLITAAAADLKSGAEA